VTPPTDHLAGRAVGVAAYRHGCRCDGCSEAQRASYRKWYAANREKQRARMKERRATQSEEQREAARAASRESARRQRRVNPAYNQRYRESQAFREAQRKWNRDSRARALAAKVAEAEKRLAFYEEYGFFGEVS